MPCFARFRELAPPVPSDRVLTLGDYFFAPAQWLKVTVLEGKLNSKHVRNRRATHTSSLVVPTNSLPSFKQTPHIKASKIQLSANLQHEDPLCEIPTRVRAADGSVKYFKPAFDTSHFIREVQTFEAIAKAGLYGKLRISNLHGVVVSDDSKLTIGLLLDWIPSIGDLQNGKCKELKEHHAKWEAQITETVSVLHSRDIVWGDVHPGNIVVNDDLDAWAIDFGGGYIDDFVCRKMYGTKEGDWQGVRNVFEYLKRQGDV